MRGSATPRSSKYRLQVDGENEVAGSLERLRDDSAFKKVKVRLTKQFLVIGSGRSLKSSEKIALSDLTTLYSIGRRTFCVAG